MTTEERLRSLLEAATPGPWRAAAISDKNALFRLDCGSINLPLQFGRDGGFTPENAAAIVAVMNIAPKLLAVVELAGMLARECKRALDAGPDMGDIPDPSAVLAALAALDEP